MVEARAQMQSLEQVQFYSIKRAKKLGRLIKSDVKKLKKLKKLTISAVQEEREVHKTLESILDNTLDIMNLDDAKAFLLRKLKDLNIDAPQI
jgi:hypothetical protein